MSHSKRNTSLAFFTAHERSQVRAHWGTQSTRLTRDSFLPFGHCRLCLGVARDPVTCGGISAPNNDTAKPQPPKVHIFCRECALNDLVAQRKEIKRAERSVEEREREDAERKAEEAEEKRRRDVEGFERANLLGFGPGEEGLDGGGNGNGTGRKRKREAREMHSSAAATSNSTSANGGKRIERDSKGGDEHHHPHEATPKADDNDSQDTKKKKSSEASFWIPSTATNTNANSTSTTKPPKQHPICPASTPSTQHAYSLKTLITVNFSEEDSTSSSSSSSSSSATAKTRICPSCKKALTNTSRPMLGAAAGGSSEGKGCGHVLCGNCVDLFLLGPGASPAVAGAVAREEVRCYVCEADLSGGNGGASAGSEPQQQHKSKTKAKQNGSSSSSKQGRLLEISCEGTGFAGGGANMAKREGVSFQC